MTTVTTPTAGSALRGRMILRDPRYNRGTAFTLDERRALGLEGLLPSGVQTLEEQSKRAYEQYEAEPSNIATTGFTSAYVVTFCAGTRVSSHKYEFSPMMLPNTTRAKVGAASAGLNWPAATAPSANR